MKIHLELFSCEITSHKDHIEVCLPNSRLLSGLIGIWSSMKITLLENISDNIFFGNLIKPSTIFQMLPVNKYLSNFQIEVMLPRDHVGHEK